MKKLIHWILMISSGFLLLTIGITSLLYNFNKPKHTDCANEIPQNFCGTVSPCINVSENAIKGKKLFNTNCAACHKLDKKMIGPALRRIEKKREFPYNDYVFDFITKEDSLNTINDRYTKTLNATYKYAFDHNFKLSKTEFKYLMSYIN